MLRMVRLSGGWIKLLDTPVGKQTYHIDAADRFQGPLDAL